MQLISVTCASILDLCTLVLYVRTTDRITRFEDANRAVYSHKMSHLYTKQVVVFAKKVVKQEELTYSVGQVKELDNKVGDCEVVTVSLASDNEAVLSNDLLDPHVASLAVLSLCQQVLVDIVDDVAQRLLTYLY